MKHIVAFVFGLLLVGRAATLYPSGNLAVLIALSSPTPNLISEFEPTWQLRTITGKVVSVLSAHLSPSFLAEAEAKLDAVFGSLNAENRRECYQGVTGNLMVGAGMVVSD